MYCPEKLKLNKFKAVSIPSNRDYFKRIGQVSVPSSQFSGEDVELPQNLRKTDMLSKGQELCDKEVKEYLDKKDSNDKS